MLPHVPERGLYAITPNGISADPDGLERARNAIAGGAVLLQYRDESADYKLQQDFARSLSRLCLQTGCALIINNDLELAINVGAAGIHLGKDDMAVDEARDILGEGAIIGASCYNQIPLAEAAQRAGATYLAFGSVFASGNKPDAVRCPMSTIEQARQMFHRPIVAIGGITHENGAVLVSAGVNYLAAIDSIFSGGSEKAQAAAISSLFDSEDTA